MLPTKNNIYEFYKNHSPFAKTCFILCDPFPQSLPSGRLLSFVFSIDPTILLPSLMRKRSICYLLPATSPGVCSFLSQADRRRVHPPQAHRSAPAEQYVPKAVAVLQAIGIPTGWHISPQHNPMHLLPWKPGDRCNRLSSIYSYYNPTSVYDKNLSINFPATNSVTAAYRDANKKSHSPVSSCKPTDIATAPTPYRIHNGSFTSPRLENFRCINVAAAVSNTQPAKEYIKNSHNKSYPVNCIIRMSSFCFCSFGGFFRFYSVSS